MALYFLLIRSFTTGSGTFILLRWFMQSLLFLSLFVDLLVHLNCIFVCIKLFSFHFVSLVAIFIFFGVFDPAVRTALSEHPCCIYTARS